MKTTRYRSVPPQALLAAALLVFLAAPSAVADTITVRWDPNPPGEQVVGYVVYVGTRLGDLTKSYDVGNQPFFVYPDAVAGQEYFFAIAAYDALNIGPYSEVSAFSNAPPFLDDPGNRASMLGQPVALQLVGSDLYGDPITYSASGLPPGLTLAAGTGLISGVAATMGQYNVTVTAFDGVLSTPRSFTWFIDGGLPTVTITSPTTQATYSTSDITVALGGSAQDDLSVLTISWENDRGGEGEASETHTWTTPPLNGTTNWTIPEVPLKVGNNVITITARDQVGNTATAVITVASPGTPPPTLTITTPTSAPTFSTSSNPIALGGMASDSVGVTAVTWVTDRAGSGTAISSAGQTSTSWSEPELWLAPGANTITVTAWNASEASSSAVLTVERGNHAPALANPGARTNAEGDLVSLQLGGSDADGDPLMYSAAGLPPGLTLNTTSGLISGTVAYTAAGVHPISLAVSDSQSTTNALFTWTVTNTNTVPVVTSAGAQSSFRGFGVVLAVTAADPDGDPLTFSASQLPPGLTIHPSTGVVSGTPTTLGTFTVVISASDGSATGQASFSWRIAAPPVPGPTNPLSPSGSIATTTPAFSWTAVGSAAYYALSVSDASAGSPTVVWYTPSAAGCPVGGTCTVAAPRSLASGLVTWAVITWNPFGYGPWSTTMSAVVDVVDPAVPTPELVAPSGPIATRTPTYKWKAISAAIWYQLTVTDAPGAVREFWYSPSQVCLSAPCSVTPNVLLGIGTAHWAVRAWRTSGAGAWTGPLYFDATDSTPGTATLVSPLNPVATVTPSFTWNAVIGTSYYVLRVTDRDNVTVDRWYLPGAVGCALGTGICIASSPVPLKAGATTWRVLTWNGSGYGPWSAAREFLVEIADPAAPTSAALIPTGRIVSTNVPYRWTAVPGAISYRLSIRNNEGPPIYFWYTPAAAGCDAAECSAVPQVALVNGTAQWQVQVWTTIGYGPWSLFVGLTVDIPAPPAPTLVSPSGAAGSKSPAFRWNASAGATLYYVRALDPTGLRADKWLTPSQVGCAGGGVCTFTLDAGITLASGAGSWQVIAWNPTGYSPWSSTMAFVVP